MSYAVLNTIAGRSVGPIGCGLMAAMKAALNGGANFWNGGTFYGSPDANSLHLLKHYFTKYPEDATRVVLILKGAYDFAAAKPDCTESGIRKSVADGLRILDGARSVDLFECARIDPDVSIEDTVTTFKTLIAEGQIRSYGLSEVKADTVRRAHIVHPVGAVEVELSLFSRHALSEGGVVETCRELGLPIVAYSPLDRGWLTGELKRRQDLAPDDYRHGFPRFQPGNFEKNVRLAEVVAEMARARGYTSAQVALAWVKRQGAIPIPGSTKAKRVEENCKEVVLSDADIEALQKRIEESDIVGHRYPEIFHEHLEM
ncbi:NADP-dependent oxidoreductase domain-containing protein [Apiospora sp. TS-2023a]